MSTRHGGRSRGLFASCNLSFHVGDEPHAVRDNRQALRVMLGLARLVSARQVHGDGIRLVDGTEDDTEVPDCDALITDRPGIGLMIQQADCQGVVMFDPRRRVVAAVHAGWRGSVHRILPKTIDTLVALFGSDPADIMAVISPSLGPCCAQFVNHRQELPADFTKYQVRPNYFDFWQISRDQMLESGLAPSHIEITGRCTRCDEDFFSYRRARTGGVPDTGRQASVIALK